MKYLSLDLEMNQPSGLIIEVGFAIGDLHAPVGTCDVAGSFLINPGEPLNPQIIKLCGITDEMLADTITLGQAHEALVIAALKFEVGRNLLTWGGNDGEYLKKKLPSLTNFWFAPTVMDVKKVYQFIRQAQSQRIQSGLAKSMAKCGLNFKGKKHRAMDDALNTLFMAQFLTQELKKNPLILKP